MPRFDITVKEVWHQTVTVHADTKEEAIQKVHDGDCEYQDNGLEYSHALEDHTWDVNEGEEE